MAASHRLDLLPNVRAGHEALRRERITPTLRYLATDERLLEPLWANLQPKLTAETFTERVAATQRQVDESSHAPAIGRARAPLDGKHERSDRRARRSGHGPIGH